ncbi:MAG: PfaD family polyunsaturated fatty acid/polyketide biosynthesis protein [Pseudomonadota bacterium]
MGSELYWHNDFDQVNFLSTQQEINHYFEQRRAKTHVIFHVESQRVGIAFNGDIGSQPAATSLVYLGTLPPTYPEWLGDRAFSETHGLRFSYVGGAMARGIASADMVIALGKIGCLGFFGSAGLTLDQVESAVITIKNTLNPMGVSWGVNLIHTSATPELEEALVDLYLKHGVNRVEAAAFMGSSRALARFACQGLYRDKAGIIRRKHYVFPKISRPEVARHYLSPISAEILADLVQNKQITEEEAELAKGIPFAEDITVESDSGGHTDGRPLNALFPVIASLRDELQQQYQFAIPTRLGAAGSLGTPQAVASAYALGAAYVLLGSVHQSCLESGLHPKGRQLLTQVGVDDTAITPSADMFEIGGKVQVVKKGSMMALRGNRLLDIYNQYDSIDSLPVAVTQELEKQIFRSSLQDIWAKTELFFSQIDPKELSRANENPKYKMALIFRWYLGKSSKWALTGDEDRVLDYQIWCGPAMGAFNAWVQGSFLENAESRQVQQVALNLLEGASCITRAQQLRSFGVNVSRFLFNYLPQQLATAE